MSMFMTRDAWDEDRDERINLIGLAAYEKEVKEANEKYDRENPDYISKSEPHVRRSDIILTDISKTSVADYIQMYITRIDQEGNIWGRTLTDSALFDKYSGATWKWEGPYKVIKSMGEEVNKE